MESEQRDQVFRKGRALSRRGALSEAAQAFRSLVDDGTDDPLHLSYCGLLTAIVHGRKAEGLRLCERALQFGSYEPEVIMNAARLYEALGCPLKAIEVLRRGLREKPGHKGMLQQIDKLSPRRQPPLSFVGRNHPLNKQLAIGLAKLTNSMGGRTSVRCTKPLARRALQTAR
jgi:tetratricopeptide (TPR) repeat protein